MQKLIENALAKETETVGFKVAHISKRSAADKKVDIEAIKAPELSKKELKKLFKQEQHEDIRALLTDRDNFRSLDVFIFALDLSIQKLYSVKNDTLEKMAYTAFQEVTNDKFIDVASTCVKALRISGKSKKQYAASLIALLLEIISTIDSAAGKPNAATKNLGPESGLQAAELLLEIWQPLSCVKAVDNTQSKLLEAASLFLNTVNVDCEKNPELRARLDIIVQNLAEIEQGIEDSIACANAIDCLVNSLGQESLDRPIGHFKMKF